MYLLTRSFKFPSRLTRLKQMQQCKARIFNISCSILMEITGYHHSEKLKLNPRPSSKHYIGDRSFVLYLLFFLKTIFQTRCLSGVHLLCRISRPLPNSFVRSAFQLRILQGEGQVLRVGLHRWRQNRCEQTNNGLTNNCWKRFGFLQVFKSYVLIWNQISQTTLKIYTSSGW